jgi:glycosyltransferase involved in cell wall biosynthesis
VKVALFVHCFYPKHFYGTEAYTLSMAKRLASLGHEPVVVSAVFAGEPRQQRLIEEYDWEGIRVLSIDKNMAPSESLRETYDQPAMRAVHERILRRLNPDIVHVCHLLNHTGALLDVTARLGLPAVATLTDFFGFCYNHTLQATDGSLCAGPSKSRDNCIACALKLMSADPKAPRTIRACANPSLGRLAAKVLAHLGGRNPEFELSGIRPADLIDRPAVLGRALGAYRAAISPSTFLARAYEDNGFPIAVTVSHHGVDFDRAPKPRSPDPSQVRLGFIGQIAPHKGVHLLIDALRAANEPSLSLAIWGPHDQAPDYLQRLQASSAGLPVHFCGPAKPSEIPHVLAGMDFLVIPSTWYENCPFVLLEGLATHTPVVIADVLGMTEFVEHGGNGFHFRRGDVAALTEVLRRIAQSQGLAQQMSARTEYRRTTHDVARELIATYEQAMRMPGSPARRTPALEREGA